MNSKTLHFYFENYKNIFLPYISYLVKKGHKIYIFNFESNLKNNKKIGEMINDNKIYQLYIDELGPENGIAIDQAEIIYNKMKKSGLSKIMGTIYQNDNVDLVIKKNLTTKIYRILYIDSYFKKLNNSKETFGKQYFVSDNASYYKRLIDKYSTFQLSFYDNIQTPYLLLIYSFFLSIYNKIIKFLKFCIILLLPYVIICLKIFIKSNTNSSHFNHVISIDQKLQLVDAGERSYSMLIDENSITKKNTCFCLNIKPEPEWLEIEINKGCNFINMQEYIKLKKILTSNITFNSLIKMMPAIFYIADFFKYPEDVVDSYILSAIIFIVWSGILQNYSFKNYIYTNQENARQIALNLLFEKHGIDTIDYSVSLGGGYLYASGVEKFNHFRHRLWSFLNPTYYFGLNDNIIQYYSLHMQKVHCYKSIGCIFSQIIVDSEKKYKKNDFIQTIFKLPISTESKIVTFFDTTFVPANNSYSNYDDCEKFYQDIIKFISDTDNNVLIIVKPSKGDSWFIDPMAPWSDKKTGKRIIELWERLRNNERVFWARDMGGQGRWIDFKYNIQAMTVSDLIITHCMSSPTAEALGAGKRSFWYESKNKHQGVLFDSIPGLVVHGYENLLKRSFELLYKINDTDYKDYLNSYVKGVVESHLDGKALERLRINISKKC